MNLVGSVHYDKKFNNAFWNGRQMVFGDGDGITFRSGGFTQIIDVIGHELAHGVTQYTARLEYEGESGALNESISDVFGSMVKQYHLKQKASDADWLIGAGIWGPGIHGVALRSMKAPGTAYNDPKLGGKDKQPGTMKDFVHTDQDHKGVHINSGIPNHAFYFVAVGFGGYSWEKAGKVWYNALLDKRLTPQTNFKLFADVTCDIAMKEFGQPGKDIVMKAWKAVGVY
jgi:Zn-dependent metalloprotease